MLRAMLRRERVNWNGYGAAILLLFTSPLVLMAAAIVVSDHRGESPMTVAACCCSPLLFLSIIPVATVGARYQPARTQERLAADLTPCGDVEALIDQIDCELAAGHTLRGTRPTMFQKSFPPAVIFTESWLLLFGADGHTFILLSDLLWAYKRIEAADDWWGGGRLTFQLCCLLGPGGGYRVRVVRLAGERWVNELVRELVRRRPDALFGYRGEWQDLHARGGEAVAREVERRRAAVAALDPDDRADRVEDGRDDAFGFVCRIDKSSQHPA